MKDVTILITSWKDILYIAFEHDPAVIAEKNSSWLDRLKFRM